MFHVNSPRGILLCQDDMYFIKIALLAAFGLFFGLSERSRGWGWVELPSCGGYNECKQAKKYLLISYPKNKNSFFYEEIKIGQVR